MTTITRADVEEILVRRCGLLLTAAELDGTTIDGTNVDLNDPIGAALRSMGYCVARVTNVSDADISEIGDEQINKLLDLAELRTLENIEGNLDQVDMTVGPRSESLNQLSVRVRMKIDTKQRAIMRQYGMDLGKLSTGAISLGFMDEADDTE